MDFNKAIEYVKSGEFKNLSHLELWTLEHVLKNATGIEAQNALKEVENFQKSMFNSTTTPKEEEFIENPNIDNPNYLKDDVLERFEQASQALEDTPANEENKYSINETLDQVAEKTAAMKLAISGEEITPEAVINARSQERMRLAVEFFSNLAGQSQKEVDYNSKPKATMFFAKLTNLVENGTPKEEIYKSLKIKPTDAQELLATSSVAVSNTNMLKSWISKAASLGQTIGKFGTKAIDFCAQVEKDNAAVSMVVGLAACYNPISAPIYAGYRMSLSARAFYNDYTKLKEENPSAKAWDLLKSKKMRDSFLSNAMAFTRSAPIIAQGYAVYNMCKKTFWTGLVENYKTSREAFNEVLETKGKDKKAIKKLWTTSNIIIASTVGVALGASAAIAIDNYLDNSILDNTPAQPTAEANETPAPKATNTASSINIPKVDILEGMRTPSGALFEPAEMPKIDLTEPAADVADRIEAKMQEVRDAIAKTSQQSPAEIRDSIEVKTQEVTDRIEAKMQEVRDAIASSDQNSTQTTEVTNSASEDLNGSQPSSTAPQDITSFLDENGHLHYKEGYVEAAYDRITNNWMSVEQTETIISSLESQGLSRDMSIRFINNAVVAGAELPQAVELVNPTHTGQDFDQSSCTTIKTKFLTLWGAEAAQTAKIELADIKAVASAFDLSNGTVNLTPEVLDTLYQLDSKLNIDGSIMHVASTPHILTDQCLGQNLHSNASYNQQTGEMVDGKSMFSSYKNGDSQYVVPQEETKVFVQNKMDPIIKSPISIEAQKIELPKINLEPQPIAAATPIAVEPQAPIIKEPVEVRPLAEGSSNSSYTERGILNVAHSSSSTDVQAKFESDMQELGAKTKTISSSASESTSLAQGSTNSPYTERGILNVAHSSSSTDAQAKFESDMQDGETSLQTRSIEGSNDPRAEFSSNSNYSERGGLNVETNVSTSTSSSSQQTMTFTEYQKSLGRQ